MSAVDSSLCTDCSSITALSLTRLDRTPHKPTLAALQQSALTCKLCALLDKALPREDSYDGRVYKLKPEDGPVVLTDGLAFLNDDDDDEDGEVEGQGEGKVKKVKLARVGVRCVGSYGEVAVYGVDPATSPITGKQIHPDPTSAIPFIARRLTLCDTHHSAYCHSPIGPSPSSPAAHAPPPRVYNITTKCLEDGSSLPPNVVYAALSYLWGYQVVPGEILTKLANLASRSTPGSFDLPSQPKCPRAYSSSIALATALGIERIWIDSVCMVQDSQEDRERHFKRFEEGVGQVYQNARVTLCAVGRDATCDVLSPRIPSAPPAECVVIPFGGTPIVVTPRIPRLFDALRAGGGADKSDVWDSRGWTYQEWLLSPRLVYFTPGQAVFECNGVYEECGEYTLSMGGHDGRSQLRTVVERGRLVELWHRVVQDYSGRILGHWSDRLNAARSVGMQLVMRVNRLDEAAGESQGKIRLVVGMLTDNLHHGLLWQGGAEGLTRITEKEWEDDKETQPPTWSWAYWRGEVTWEMHLRGAPSKLDVLAIDEEKLTLRNAEVFRARVGMSLRLEGEYDLSAYARGVGQKTTSQGYKMAHWGRMRALVYPGREPGDIIGRASFDDPEFKKELEAGEVVCVIVSDNIPISNPHTFVQTESRNVLLVAKKGEVYTRVGVGELFVRSGEKVTEAPPSSVVPELVLV